ncbi:MAG: tyrosine-type recombinase/integrase [bacterium]
MAIERIKKSDISETNKETILKFCEDCSVKGLSKPRVLFYLNRLLSIGKMLGKDFAEAKKEDIKKLVQEVNNREHSENTKKDSRIAIKRFYQWLRGIEEKGVYPDEVKWIPTTLKQDKHILPEELLTEDEINKMINAAEHPRDKALISTLADSGCRIGELLTLRLKHLIFDKYSAVLTVNGKTGMRRIRVIGATPYLASWKDVHPDKDDPEAPLWVVRGTTKEIAKDKNKLKNYKFNWGYSIGYRGATKMLQKLAEKGKIKKRVNPHSFRHARATFLANKLTEAQLKELFGWTQSSDMAAVYVHMSGRDTDKALLNVYGLAQDEEKERSKFELRKCSRCSKQNPATATICEACGGALDLKEAMKIDTEQKTVMDMLIKMQKEQNEMKNAFEKLSGKKFDVILPVNKEKMIRRKSK